MKSEDPPSTQVAVPHLQGKTECSWISKQDQVLPPELEEAPQITVPLSVADPHHWNIMDDPIFPSCLATFRVRHEASLASGTAASSGGASSRGGGSTPLQELPSVSWPQPPPTPPLEWQEVDKRVTEVMDQVPSPTTARDWLCPRDRPSPLQVSHGGVPPAQGHYQ